MNKEKQIAEFIQMIESHWARLVSAATEHLTGLEAVEWDRVVRDTFALAWRHRDSIDVSKLSLPLWFGELAYMARHSQTVRTIEEDEVLAAMVPAAEAPKEYVAMKGVHEPWEAPQKVGKECPPCWRCMYHQGWLPARKVVRTVYSDAEVDAICKVLDDRKILIAQYVRGEYDEEILDDDDQSPNSF